MLQELNRRLDKISGFVDGINERIENDTSDLIPPNPNRLLRRHKIESQIEENLFSADLQQLHESIPRSYIGPEFIRQLIEHESPDYSTLSQSSTRNYYYYHGDQ